MGELSCIALFGPGNLAGAIREWRKDSDPYRQAGIGWAVLHLMEQYLPHNKWKAQPAYYIQHRRRGWEVFVERSLMLQTSERASCPICFVCTLSTSGHRPEKAVPIPEGLRHQTLCYTSGNVSTRPPLRSSFAPYTSISSTSTSNSVKHPQ